MKIAMNDARKSVGFRDGVLIYVSAALVDMLLVLVCIRPLGFGQDLSFWAVALLVLLAGPQLQMGLFSAGRISQMYADNRRLCVGVCLGYGSVIALASLLPFALWMNFVGSLGGAVGVVCWMFWVLLAGPSLAAFLLEVGYQWRVHRTEEAVEK